MTGALTAWLRLSGWLFCIGLATSRLALIAHELWAHGGAALAIGGAIDDWRLFWFGGGWIRYELAGSPTPGQALLLSLAGVAIEVVLAALAVILARRARQRPSLALALRLAAGLLAVHATFYFAAGSHHGYGDGRAVHELAAPGLRWTLVIAAAAAGVAAAWWLGATLATAGRWLPGRRGQRAALLAAAAVLAAALHGGLAWGEQRARRPDRTYGAIMQRQVDRRMDAELARLAAQAAADGQRLDLEARRAELAQRYRVFPLAWVLAAAMGAAALAGLWRALAGVVAAGTGLPARALWAAAGVAAAALALVAALATG